jgi:lipid A 3-O-deacylase
MIVRTKAVLARAAGLAAAFATMPLAEAQAPPPSAAPDPTAIWTLQDENASISTAKLTDRYYVNGLRLGYTSPTGAVPDALENLSRIIFGDGQTRFAIDLTQQIFTPADTTATVPPPGDRPYAGLLLANLSLLTDTAETRSILGLSLGLVGPDTGAEQLQNGFHDVIGQGHDNGWSTQLHDEPVFNFQSARTWREPMGTLFGLETDALLDASAGLGTVRIYAEGGGQLRIGQGLDSDFGTARLLPGMSGGDAFRATRPIAWYAFLGGDGQGVARDITLDGNTFRSSRSVTLDPFVGELQAGVAIMAFGTRLTYTQVFQTQEFRHQKGGLHQFGSLALSVRF